MSFFLLWNFLTEFWSEWIYILVKLLLPRDFPNSSVGKESTCNAGDPVWIPGSGRSPGEGIVYSLQYSWASLVDQPVKNPPAMWETWFDPWVGKIPWRKERLPTPVFCPGEFHGLNSPWGHKESDKTKWLSLYYSFLSLLSYWRLCDWSQRENKLLDFDTLFSVYFSHALLYRLKLNHSYKHLNSE